MPAPHRSPVPRAPRKWSWPATPATDASATPCSSGPSARCAVTGRTRLLPTTSRPKHRPPGCTPPTRQPPRRHPPRLPQDPDPVRREHRLGTHPQRRCLTPPQLGMSAAESESTNCRRQRAVVPRMLLHAVRGVDGAPHGPSDDNRAPGRKLADIPGAMRAALAFAAPPVMRQRVASGAGGFWQLSPAQVRPVCSVGQSL